MEFKSKYGIGELVYLKTDLEQLERLITGVKFNANGIVYTLQQGVYESTHYEIEISYEKDVLKMIK